MFACVRACMCVCKRCTSSYHICEPGMNRVNGPSMSQSQHSFN